MSFNIIIDSKKTAGFSENKLSALLPETLFFTGEWEMALTSVWYNKVIRGPVYINCPVIETQIVGEKWEKSLFVMLPPLVKNGKQTMGGHAFLGQGTNQQFKKIFEPHVSKIDLSFFLSEGEAFAPPLGAHMVLNLEFRKRS